MTDRALALALLLLFGGALALAARGPLWTQESEGSHCKANPWWLDNLDILGSGSMNCTGGCEGSACRATTGEASVVPPPLEPYTHAAWCACGPGEAPSPCCSVIGYWLVNAQGKIEIEFEERGICGIPEGCPPGSVCTLVLGQQTTSGPPYLTLHTRITHCL